MLGQDRSKKPLLCGPCASLGDLGTWVKLKYYICGLNELGAFRCQIWCLISFFQKWFTKFRLKYEFLSGHLHPYMGVGIKVSKLNEAEKKKPSEAVSSKWASSVLHPVFFLSLFPLNHFKSLWFHCLICLASSKKFKNTS